MAVVLGTPPGNDLILALALPRLQPPAGTIAVDKLRVDLLGHVTVEGASVRDAEGVELYGADRVELEIRLGALVGRRVVVDRAHVAGLRVGLAQGERCLPPAGPWDDGLPAAPSGPWRGLGFDLDVRSLELDGADIRFCGGVPFDFEAVAARGTVTIHGPLVAARVTVTGQSGAPVAGALGIDLRASWDGDRVVAESVVVDLGPNHAEVRGVVGDLGGEGTLALTFAPLSVLPSSLGLDDLQGPLVGSGEVTGTFATPSTQLSLATPGGSAQVRAAFDLRGARPTWTAAVDSEGLDLHHVLPGLPPTSAGGHYEAKGAGFGWPDDLDATVIVQGRASVAGGQPGPFVVSGTANLHAGKVSTEGLLVSTPAGRITLDGKVDILGSGAALTVRELEVDLSRLAAYGVPGLRGSVRYRGQVGATWGSPTVTFDGAVSGTRLGYEQAVDVATASGRLAGAWSPEAVALRGGLDVTGLAGAVTIEGAHVAVDVAGALPRGLSGPVSVQAEGVTIASYVADTLKLEATLQGPTVRLSAEAHQGESVLAAVAGELGLDPLSGNLSRLEFAPGSTRWVNTAPVTFTVDGARVRNLRVALAAGDSRVVVRGEGGASGPLDLRAELTSLSLAEAEDLDATLLPGWEGLVGGWATVGGTAESPEIEVELQVAGLHIPEAVTDLDATLAAHTAADGLWVEADAAGPDGKVARLAGTLPLSLSSTAAGLRPDGPLDLRLTVLPGGEERFERVVPGLDLPRFRASAEVRLGGTAAAPEVALTASAAAPPVEGAPWMFVDVDATTEAGVVTLRTVLRERLVRRAELTGTFGLALDEVASLWLGRPKRWATVYDLVSDLSLDLVPLQLPLEALAPDGLAGLTGSLLGGFHVTGDELAPQIEGAMLVIGGRIGQVELSRAQLTVSPRERVGYTIDLDLAMAGDGGLRVHGLIPWASRLDEDLGKEVERAGLLLAVEGAGVGPDGAPLGIPLRALDGIVPGFEGGAGRVEVRGVVTGSLSSPAPQLEVTLKDGGFALRTTGIRYHDVSLTGTIDADAVRVTSLALDTDPFEGGLRAIDVELPRRAGEFDLRGSLALGLDRWAPTTLRGTVHLDRTRIVELPSRTLRVSGDLELGGTWPQVEVRGSLGVDRGYLRIAEGFFTHTDELALDPEVRVARPGAEVEDTADEAAFPLPKLAVEIALNRAVDVDITMPTEQMLGDVGALFSNLRVETTLDGELDVLAADDQIALAGAVDVLRGSAMLLGKRFDVEEGVVAFTGRDIADPVLVLTAQHHTSEYGTILADIGGTPTHPEVQFSGEGGMSADDAISILVFGSPLSGIDSGSANALAAVVMSTLTRGLADARRSTPLDVVDISTTGASRVGTRLGRNVLVVLVVDPGADEGESPLTVSVELQLPKRWFLVAEYGTAGDTAVRAVRKWRF